MHGSAGRGLRAALDEEGVASNSDTAVHRKVLGAAAELRSATQNARSVSSSGGPVCSCLSAVTYCGRATFSIKMPVSARPRHITRAQTDEEYEIMERGGGVWLSPPHLHAGDPLLGRRASGA